MTLNQIKTDLTNFFESHSQIRTTIWMELDKFIAKRDNIYPVVNMEWMNSNTDDKVISHTIRFLIGDVYNPNIIGIEDEVFSDSLQITQDFLIWLYENDNFSYNTNVNIQKFTDDNGDRIAGVTFQIVLSQVISGGLCAIPTK